MKSRPPGRSRLGDDLGPAADVGQPAERADAGVDEIEALAAERIGRAVEIGLDEVDRRLPTASARRRPCSSAGAEKSSAGHLARRAGRARPCRCRCGTAGAPRRGPSMSPSRGAVEAHDLAQERRIVGEARDGVVRRRGVRRDAVVPVRAVDVAVVVHARSVAHAAWHGQQPRTPPGLLPDARPGVTS